MVAEEEAAGAKTSQVAVVSEVSSMGAAGSSVPPSARRPGSLSTPRIPRRHYDRRLSFCLRRNAHPGPLHRDRSHRLVTRRGAVAQAVAVGVGEHGGQIHQGGAPQPHPLRPQGPRLRAAIARLHRHRNGPGGTQPLRIDRGDRDCRPPQGPGGDGHQGIGHPHPDDGAVGGGRRVGELAALRVTEVTGHIHPHRRLSQAQDLRRQARAQGEAAGLLQAGEHFFHFGPV